MDKLSRTEVLTLAESPGPAVSIFLPTDSQGQSGERDSRLLHQLLTQAQAALVAGGLRDIEAARLLRPAGELLDDGLFWAHQSAGLALFLNPSQGLRLRLPLSFEAAWEVGARFNIRPLLPLLAASGSYYLLAASENGARLFGGTREGLEELDLPAAPASAKAANQFESHERYLGFHSGAPQRGGRFSAMFYGIGSRADEAKGDTAEYARLLASAVDKALPDESAPLLLCGVESLCAMLRAELAYRHLVPEALSGNPDELSPAELHGKAWPLLAPRFETALGQALAEYEAQAGTGRTVAGIEAALEAAAAGQVKSLFIDHGQALWGQLDESTGQVTVASNGALSRVELLDRCAVLALRQGGAVFELPAGQLPGGAAVCAVLRY